ncbi:MAG TPA: hypothetical protein VFX48_04555, partial [Saprospiraceae bacterium]|nr:hypothetical protein [Saprospiraceae bacterium]
MRFNFIYILAFLCLIAALPFIKKSIVTSNEFYGLAENQVRSINLEFPVEIVRTYKSMGEPVRVGDTIMRYKRLDVVAKQQILAYDREYTLKQIQADQEQSKG